MTADGRLRAARSPRGTIISTGEDTPPGQSLLARLLLLTMSRTAMNWSRLTVCQKDAAAGLYVGAMAAFIRSIAGRFEEVQQQLREIASDLRQRLESKQIHRRTPGIVAELGAALELFLKFAVEAGALSGEESLALWERSWTTLCEIASLQEQEQACSDPTGHFFELLVAAIASGRAHVAGADGCAPGNATAWGWRNEDGLRPKGVRVGWVDGEDLYLEPRASYTAAQQMAREGDEAPLGVQSRGLRSRLDDRNLLLGTETRGGQRHLTIRRHLEGMRRVVLHVSSAHLADIQQVNPLGVAQQAQSNQPLLQCQGEARLNGTGSTGHSPSNAAVGVPLTGPSELAASRGTVDRPTSDAAGPVGPLTGHQEALAPADVDEERRS
jgi:hypothetical protein